MNPPQLVQAVDASPIRKGESLNASKKALQDTFGRRVSYLRLSVTDRCDFRCVYCMAEDMTFLPRKEVLTLEEMSLLSQAFIELGTKKIRVTGGEPLIRRGIVALCSNLTSIDGLEELCITTNGSKLGTLAAPLKEAGVKRINVSLDTLEDHRFKHITRFGELNDVLNGIDTAVKCGFDRIKINAVLMQNYNLHEAAHLARYAVEQGCDISFIEEMPLGDITSHARDAEFISSEDVRELLSKDFTFIEQSSIHDEHAGPTRYWNIEGYDGRIGFISPHSENFCESCNRVRVTASGRLLLCLGNEHSVDLRACLRDESLMNVSQREKLDRLKNTIIDAMQIKPEKHEFNLQEEPQILRFMNTTGG